MNHKQKLLLLAVPSILTLSCNQSAQKEESYTANYSLINNIDTTASPSQDFYQYACGNWLKENPLTPEYARYGVFEQLGEKNKKQLVDLITTITSKSNPQGSIAQKISELYLLGKDSDLLNKQGATPLLIDLKKVACLKTKSELNSLIGELNKMGISPFFNAYVYADDKNSTLNILHLAQGGLNMGNRDYYLKKGTQEEAIRKAYLTYMRTAFTLCGNTPEESAKKAVSILALETEIAEAHLSKTEQRDPYLNYHKKSVQELAQLAPAIDWKIFFKTNQFNEVKTLNVAHPKAIERISTIIENHSLQELKDYCSWCIINEAAPYLSDAFVSTHFKFFGETLSGTTAMQPRWKRVLNTVNGVLGEAVGKLYVEEHFPESSKQKMLDLVKNLQQSLGERLSMAPWMDEKTKEKAKEKLATFTIKIGYPDKWKDYSNLSIVADCYWNNIKRSAIFEHNEMAKKLNQKVDKMEWLMNPQTINAYYNPATNEICFPAAILQPPFFDPEAPDAINYGAIGVVIGHEMTHGFDDQGRQYDKTGNLSEWWTKEDAKKFNQRAKVTEDYFNNITVLDSLKANGKLTLGENIADYGGLTVSFNAFRKIVDKELLFKKQKNGFSPAQLFFLSYASVWANNIRDKEIIKRTQTDPHSLGEWRVNGTLPHINAFYEAFDIPKEAAMYLPKEKRTAIW